MIDDDQSLRADVPDKFVDNHNDVFAQGCFRKLVVVLP